MDSPTISFLVTCHNEPEIDGLLRKLHERIKLNPQDEVVILDDFSTDENFIQTLETWSKVDGFSVHKHALSGDFAAHKNYGTDLCTKEFIFQIDADEYPARTILDNITYVLAANPTIELFRVPRVNIVRGLTEEIASKWMWKVTKLPDFGELPIINWERDYQSRIYKKTPEIRWKKKLHETISGATLISDFPLYTDFALIHDKTIERQEAQNEFYNKNWSAQANMGLG